MSGPVLGVLVAEGAAAFARAGIECAELEARLLAQHVFGLNRAGLIVHERDTAGDGAAARFAALVSRRLSREPLAYILGEREFWGLPFSVSRDVLIPRPETEFLVEQALASSRAAGADASWQALDLGTGSGVIAVVLARELGCGVTAVDRSAAALKVAAENARRHGVAERIAFVRGDCFAALPAGARYDVLVSNPPYVSAREMAALAPEVGCFEPRSALFGGPDGLDCLSAISRNAGPFLRPGAGLFLEIGATQAEAVRSLFTASSSYEDVRILPDLAGRSRVLAARAAA